jgi:hypothetical protein
MSRDQTRFCDTCGKELHPVHVGGDTCRDCLVVILAGSVPDDEREDEEDPRPVADGEPAEPEDGDYTTTDHERFYQDGKLAVLVEEGAEWAHALKAHMDEQRFWPNVWFLSDHGNAHLIDMFDALGEADIREGID